MISTTMTIAAMAMILRFLLECKRYLLRLQAQKAALAGEETRAF
jgi:hypothetical protein